MNHAELLEKYMRHVRQAEGSDFTDRLNERGQAEVQFTPEEVAELERIAALISTNLWQE